MTATLNELINANPQAPTRGSVLPCETHEKVEASNPRAKFYLLQRAQNFSTYHGSAMTLEWSESDGFIHLRAMHSKGNP